MKKDASKAALPVASHLIAEFVKLVGQAETASREILVAHVRDGFSADAKVTKVSIDRTLKECKATKQKRPDGKYTWILDTAEVVSPFR